MKNRTAFQKIKICFWMSCLCAGMAGCTNDGLMNKEEAQTDPIPVPTTLVQEEVEQAVEAERIQNVPDIYYAYHTLNETDRMLYFEVLDALTEREEEITVSTVDAEVLKHVFTCVMNDHPELFYVEGYQYTKYTVADRVTQISFYGTYTMSQEEIDNNQKAIDEYTRLCLSGMPQSDDEYDKVKYLYDYIVEKTDYEKDAPNNQNICSVFVEHRSVCQGYAKALQYLMQKTGMVSMLVTGFTEQEGHAWNLVRVNGAYYYIDATWGDAFYTIEDESVATKGESLPINYDYFLVTTNDLYVTHEPDDEIELPKCTEQKDNYYIREGLYLTEYDEEKLKKIFEQTYADESRYVMFRCSDEAVFDEIREKLIDNQEVFQYIDNEGKSIAYSDNRTQRTISFWI